MLQSTDYRGQQRALATTCIVRAITQRSRYRAIALGLDETGLISKACRATVSPALAKAMICASLARKREWVGLEKSGGCGRAPLWA